MVNVSSPDQIARRRALQATRDDRRSRWLLLAFFGLAIIWGERSVRLPEESTLDLILPIAFTICVGWWAIIDARRRNQPIPRMSPPWFYLLGAVLVPGYLIWTRGWRGLGWLLLTTACWYLLATVSMHSFGTLAYGREWWRALGF